MKHIVMLTVVVVALAGAAVRSVATRRPEPQGKTVQVINLRLSVDGKELARISTPDGVMATMAKESGEQLGLTPAVQGAVVMLTVSVKGATGAYSTAGRYSLSRNMPASVGTQKTPLTVEWLETTTVTLAGGAVAGSSPCTTCCVVCEGITFCACEVTTPCGHCCCKDTCACVDKL